MASKAANKAKYEYNKKYMEAYWERRAKGQTSTETSKKSVRQTTVTFFDDEVTLDRTDVDITVSRQGKSDERYIKALELANKTLTSENKRLVRLMLKYKKLIRQITELYHEE